MERYLTDAVYARRVRSRPPELEREEKHLYAELSARISGEDYLRFQTADSSGQSDCENIV